MKRYLMTGIAALALCVGFTSCSHEITQLTDEEKQAFEKEQIVKNYEAAFVKTFGQPATSQDWGFGASSTRTRVAETNSNQWFDGVTEKFKHLVKPADVTAREEEVVTKWFKDNQHPTCDEISLSEFFVQQVHFGDKKYTAKDGNGANHEVVGGNQMDWLFAYSPTEQTVWINGVETKTHMDHINNFNTSAPKRTDTGLSNMQLMMNSSTENFGFHESFNSQNTRYYNVKDYNWVIKAIEVDGVVGYYVGFDYESHGNQGDFNPDGYFDDRIIKIVPGNGIIPQKEVLRVFAEDLIAGADETVAVIDPNSPSDWDFNDVVFDVEKIDANHAKITLWAAGGTLPLQINSINGTLYEGGCEVHQKFNVGVKTMVNTHAKDIVTAGYNWEDDLKERVFTITIPEELGTFDDYDNFPAAVRDLVRIEVKKGNTWFELTAEKGKPACKIATSASGIRWMKERIDIRLGYPLFKQYVGYPNSNWWTEYNEPALYWNKDGNSTWCLDCHPETANLSD